MKRKAKRDPRKDLMKSIDNMKSDELACYIKNMFLLTGTLILNIENKNELKKLTREIK